MLMDNLFEEISSGYGNKKVKSLCNKLGKKLSFKNMGDVENLCHLAYWLYILGKKEMAKKCIALTHSIQFDGNYNVWTFIHSMWGLEIRILREEDKHNEADVMCAAIDRHTLTPNAKTNETPEECKRREMQRRSNFVLGIHPDKTMEVSNRREVERAIAEGDLKSANVWRFLALLHLIGDTETGLFPDLNKDKNKIEAIIKDYIQKILG